MSVAARWAVLVLGTIVAALGMCLLDLANEGQVTMAVLWDGMSQKLPVTIGQACYLTSLFMIAFSLYYDRSQVRLGTVLHFILYGFAFDFFLPRLPQPSTFGMVLAYAALGILLLGVGIGVYAYARLGRGPYEGVTFALCEKRQWQMKYVRAVCDGVFILIGAALGGAVGLVTLLNLFLCGVLIQRTTMGLDRLFLQKALPQEGEGILITEPAAQL